jgi:hypothetical protein
MRGVSSLTIAASGGTAQAASSQTGKPGQTGDGKPGQTGANRETGGNRAETGNRGKPGTVPNYPVSERARAAACFNGKTGDKTGKPGKTGDSTKLPRFRKGQSRRLLQRATWRARVQIPP